MMFVAARFGQDPFRIMREWSLGEQCLASDFELLCQREEARRRSMD